MREQKIAETPVDSQKIRQDAGSLGYIESNQAIPGQKPSQQVLRPSHYIEPEIVKIPFSSN